MPDIVIAFFALGLLAGLVKSDLKVPPSYLRNLIHSVDADFGIKGRDVTPWAHPKLSA